MNKQIEYMERELAALRKEVDEMGIRFTLAEAWIALYRLAYDALRSWSIDFMKLPEYGLGYPAFNSNKVDAVDKLPLSQARNVYIEWINKVSTGIRAAVRRKQFKVHDNTPTDTRH